MTNLEMALSYLRQASAVLLEAELHRRSRLWHLVVRRSQEAVELALKALLRAAGLEVPHVHDVGVFVKEHASSLPTSFTQHLDRVISVSRALRKERELSFYGDEVVGAPAEQLYGELDADRALADARFIVEACTKCCAPESGT